MQWSIAVDPDTAYKLAQIADGKVLQTAAELFKTAVGAAHAEWKRERNSTQHDATAEMPVLVEDYYR